MKTNRQLKLLEQAIVHLQDCKDASDHKQSLITLRVHNPKICTYKARTPIMSDATWGWKVSLALQSSSNPSHTWYWRRSRHSPREDLSCFWHGDSDIYKRCTFSQELWEAPTHMKNVSAKQVETQSRTRVYPRLWETRTAETRPTSNMMLTAILDLDFLGEVLLVKTLEGSKEGAAECCCARSEN